MKVLKNVMKQVGVFILAVALVMGVVPIPHVTEVAKAEVTGAGTEDSPYMVTTWTDLMAKMAEGGHIRLDSDVSDTEKSSDSYLTVPAGKTVVLDLAGHTIDRSLTAAIENGFVISVYGDLTVNDSSTSGSGTITGGYNSSGYGGGVYVHGVSSLFNLYGGTITGNKVSYHGGGVSVCEGEFHIKGKCSVTGNHQESSQELSDDDVFLVGSDPYIIIDGALDESTRIGVYTDISGDEQDVTSGFSDESGAKKGSTNNFFCNNENKRIKMGYREIMVASGYDITLPAEGNELYYIYASTESIYAADDTENIGEIQCAAGGDTVYIHFSMSDDYSLLSVQYQNYDEETGEPVWKDMVRVNYAKGIYTYSFEMPNNDTQVRLNCLPKIKYKDADGDEQTCSDYNILSGGGATTLPGGWYVVPKDTTVNYTGTVTLSGNTNIILCDGATMNIGTDTETGRIKNYCIKGDKYSLNVYGQSSGTGKLNAYNYSQQHTIFVKSLTVNGGTVMANDDRNIGVPFYLQIGNLTVNGGSVTANASGYTNPAVYCNEGGKVLMNGGSLTATSMVANTIESDLVMTGGTLTATAGKGYSINGNVDFNGGNLIAETTNDNATDKGISGTISLDYTGAEDTFFATDWGTDNLTIADGKTFTDGHSNVLNGTINTYKDRDLYPAVYVKKTDPTGGGMDVTGNVWRLKDLTSDTKAIVKVHHNSLGWLPSITVTKASGGTISQDDITCTGPDTDGKTYTFEFPMPPENVTVTAEFTMVPITGDCSATANDHVTYTLTDTDGDKKYDKLVISGTGAMKDYEESQNTPPWYGNYWNTINDIEICEGVTLIGNYAFRKLGKIASVTIPASVESIGDYAFSECINLASIRILGKPVTIGTIPFWTKNSNTMVYASAVNATDALTNACYDEEESPAGITYICTAPTAPTETLTYNGSAQTWPLPAPTNCGYTISGNTATNVGDYTATVTLNAEAGKTVSGKTKTVKYVWGDVSAPATWTSAEDTDAKNYSWKIAPMQVYISGVSASDKTYDGTLPTTVTGTPVVKKVSDDSVVDDLTVSNVSASFAGEKAGMGKVVTLFAILSDTTNYTLNLKVTNEKLALTADIIPKPVTITGLSAQNKTYDGTVDATVSGTAVIVGVLTGDNVSVKHGTARFWDANVGTDKKVTFNNYELNGTDAGNYYLSDQPASVKANITKADHSAETVTGKARAGSSGWIELLPVLVDGYTTLQVTEPDSSSIISAASIDGTKLMFTLKSEGVELGDTGTSEVTVSSGNYNDYTIAATVTASEKDVPLLTADPITVTYNGEAVPDSRITGTAKVGEADIAGIWAFKDGQELTDVADSGTKTVVFTPTDADIYESVEITLTLTINKADVTGAPNYTKISASRKTLADAALAIGTLTPAGGVLAWNDAQTTMVTKGTAYGWTYTPADEDNYNVKTGSIVVWENTPVNPTFAPTANPTSAPTTKPTSAPINKPTSAPVTVPSIAPTAAPAASAAPVATTAPSAAPAASAAPGTGEPVTTTNPDGSTTTTTTTIGTDGSTTTTTTTVGTDGSTTTRAVTTDANGNKKVTEQIKKPSGDYTRVTMNTTVKKDENGNIIGVTVTIGTEKKTGKTTQKASFVVLNIGIQAVTKVSIPNVKELLKRAEPKNAVALTKATTDAKNRTITIEKTVKSDGKTYTVTVLKKGFLKANKKAPKKIVIKAASLTKIEKNAFKGIARKATIVVEASKKQFKKIKKMIKKSGVPKKVKIKRV